MRGNKTAKLIIVLVGLFFLMGFYPREAVARERFEEKFEKTVSLAKDGEVTLRNITGSIEVKSWDKGEVKIDALKISRAPTLDEAKENAKEVEIEVKKEGKILRIETKYPESRGIWRKRSLNVSVTYSLWIPSKASVKINSVTGSVELEKIGGAAKVNIVTGNIGVRKADKGVDCKTVTGRIEIQNITGAAFLETVTGRLSVSQVKGSIRAKVVTGKIELREVSEADSVEGNTVTGSVTYEGKINRDGRYALSTHTGRIDVTLPADSGFDLEAKTFSGKIESDFEITVSGEISRRRIYGVVGKGGAVVKLSTFSGNISLRKR